MIAPGVACAAGIVSCALAAAALAAVRPAARSAARVEGLLLVAGAAFLGVWAAAAGGGAAVPRTLGFGVGLPWPYGALRFGLPGTAAAWAALAAVLFAATGVARAGGYGPGGTGTVALQHGLLVSVAAFVASRSPLGLLLSWEALSLVAYLLVIRDRPRVQRASWALFALSEAGSVALLFALLVWQAAPSVGGVAALGGAWPLALALLALVAFGTKAGLFPFLVWVPFAEPEADGDTAGLLSGLLTAVGVAGFLRVTAAVAPPAWPLGVVTGLLGLAGAVYGVLMGMVERDAKRVLAYGTLEALGLCFAGLGLAGVLGAVGAGSAAALAAAGSWILLLAHGGAKYALFLLSGHVERAGGLRLLDRMGGLLRRAPRAGTASLAAVVALAGLPPFGGFLGEWLLVEACLVPTPRSPALHVALAFAAAALALVGAAGLTLYLRWFGIGWLGKARSARAGRCPDAPAGTILGAWLGAAVAAAAGIAAGWLLPWFQAVAGGPAGAPIVAPTYLTPRPYAGIVALGAALFRGVAGSTGNVLFPAGGFSVASPWDLALFILVSGPLTALACGRGRRTRVRRVRAWIGGEPAGSPAHTWTAEGFSHPLRLAFAGFFGLSRTRRPVGDDPAAAAAMPAPARIHYRADVVLRLEQQLYRPLLSAASRLAGAVRRTQSGRVSDYVLLLLGVLVAGLFVLAWRP